MNKNFKSISIITILVIFSTFINACGQTKDDNSDQLSLASAKSMASEATTETSSAPVKVFNISKVSKPVSGKFVDFSWNDNGNEIKFSEMIKGKVVLLNFWATWCGPCRREIPDLIQIHKELSPGSFVIIGVALERDDAHAFDLVKSFAEKNGITYINFIDTDKSYASSYGGIGAVPTTYIIDKNGSIAETIVGGRSKDAFLQSIRAASK